MASPGSRRHRGLRVLAYAACGLLLWLLCLVTVQALLSRRLARSQMIQLSSEVAFSLRLGELALEQYPMEAVAELSGLELAKSPPPASPRGVAEAEALHQQLCDQLGYCREVVAAGGGLWVEMVSPIEPIWLSVSLPRLRRWPPDPLSLVLSLVASGLGLSTLVLSLEVQRPLRQLEHSLQQLGSGQEPEPLSERGTRAVRQITRRFNALLRSLEEARRERATMLAGIGHDLNSPITRLRLRLHLAENQPMTAADVAKAQADLDALERITRQFISFARGDGDEVPVQLDLDALLAEVAGQSGLPGLQLRLQPLRAWVRPTALSRAVGNLLSNAASHGQPPFQLALEPWNGAGFSITVRDGGSGIPDQLWEQALQPFRRLDEARGGDGHCGLGLAIAQRAAAAHGGELFHRHAPEGGYTLGLRGHSLSDLVTSQGPAVRPEADRSPRIKPVAPD
ncbi:ATP-binding protein [Cyanobium sp. NIES-981]|uniref:ATP-binding protein n=1 Tax=Cyanobium sp. NIES-981 TaxID=1851505 RepID=UPI0007DDA23C|nr:ATP-binding protein [Cyanobium sp. NIES-981]SBO41901.1 putative Osmolarity sensor protein EnvZ [Cyanobium sp. NIES-981]